MPPARQDIPWWLWNSRRAPFAVHTAGYGLGLCAAAGTYAALRDGDLFLIYGFFGAMAGGTLAEGLWRRHADEPNAGLMLAAAGAWTLGTVLFLTHLKPAAIVAVPLFLAALAIDTTVTRRERRPT